MRALSSLGQSATYILHETALSWLQNKHVNTVSG